MLEDSSASEVRRRTVDLLGFLSAVAREVGPQPIRNIARLPFVLSSNDVLEHRAVRVGPTPSDPAWLRIARVEPHPYAHAPSAVVEILDDRKCLEDPTRTPRIDEHALEVVTTGIASDHTWTHGDDPWTVQDERRAEFEKWLQSTWEPWARLTRPVAAARQLYSRLFELHLSAEAENATNELVIGHARVRTPGSSIDTPILITRVSIAIDPADATISINPEGSTELELDNLEGTGLQGLASLAELRDAVRDSPPDVWSEQDFLDTRTRVVAQLGLEARLAEEVGGSGPSPRITVDDTWALLMRKRPAREERFYDELAQKLQDDEVLPQALASVLSDDDAVSSAARAHGGTIERNDGTARRLLMPLPSNAEQERIANQLAHSRGVTVQGPPGTGKSHAIANLVSHLVAQGKRILVTAQNEQALNVLQDKIPAELRDLSLAVVGSSSMAIEHLRTSVQSLQDSLTDLDVPVASRKLHDLEQKIDQLRDTAARTDAALVDALRSESATYQLPEGRVRAPEVAEWLANDSHLDLVPDRVPPRTPLPISADEFRILAELARSLAPEDVAATVLDLPTSDWVPSTTDLTALLLRRDALRTSATRLEDDGLLLDAVRHLTDTERERIAARASDESAKLRIIEGTWERTWAKHVRDATEVFAWLSPHIGELRESLTRGRHLMSALLGHEIELAASDPHVLRPLLDEWRRRLQAGKKLPLLGAKSLRDLSSQARVDGYSITTVAQVDLLTTMLDLRDHMARTRRLLKQVLDPLAIPVRLDASDHALLHEASEILDRMDAIQKWWQDTYPSVTQQVAPLVALRDPAGTAASLGVVAQLLRRADSLREELALTAQVTELDARLAEHSKAKGASPLWSSLLSALRLESTSGWESAQQEIHRLELLKPSVARRETLSNSIAAAGAPRWCQAILDSQGDAEVTGDPTTFELTWARSAARTWLDDLHTQSNVSSLMSRSHEVADELRRTILEAANLSARIELKANLKDSRRRALDTWLTAIRRVGKGTGKNAPRFQAEARDALPAAMGSIPIWIMPIHRVMENFSPTRSDLFDVVIVDESSQCDLLSLGVLALGKKAVVVGDDKQTTPQRPGTATDPIADLQAQYLHGAMGARLLTIDESLYSIASRAFPSVIALKEHFRCVPEIIEFSNRYYDNAILPLREVTRPEIGAPVRAVKVEGAISQTQGSHRVNVDEAEAIAAQIEDCISDRAYDGLTFGVVTMMSGPQANIIQDKIRERIGDQEFEGRRLRVGNPPLFQGDERNVMFISTVAHDATFAATRAQHSQWANVAVSRARDQLWVFHSMDPSTLHHDDQRRAIIDYAVSRDGVEDKAQLYELTESKFERDVLSHMLDRGLDVTPQHKVGAYRIDFVINIAPGLRLAVECDGDRFHGPEQWSDDVRRQRVLERLGWEFFRVRASQYYLNPEASLSHLWSRVNELRLEAERTSQQKAQQAALRDEQRAKSLERRAREAAVAAEVREPYVRARTTAATPMSRSAGPIPVPAVRLIAEEPDGAAAKPTPLRDGSPRDVESATRLSKGVTDDLQVVPLASTPVKNDRAPVPAPAATPVTSDSSGRAQVSNEARAANLARATAPGGLPDASVIRRWALAKGFDVGTRGRLPLPVYQAFAAEYSLRSPQPGADAPEARRNDGVGQGSATSQPTGPPSTPVVPDPRTVINAWVRGRAYSMSTDGVVSVKSSGREPSRAMGGPAALQAAQAMARIRPHGGLFKVSPEGVVATLVNERPTFVTNVDPHQWFGDPDNR